MMQGELDTIILTFKNKSTKSIDCKPYNLTALYLCSEQERLMLYSHNISKYEYIEKLHRYLFPIYSEICSIKATTDNAEIEFTPHPNHFPFYEEGNVLIRSEEPPAICLAIIGLNGYTGEDETN